MQYRLKKRERDKKQVQDKDYDFDTRATFLRNILEITQHDTYDLCS